MKKIIIFCAVILFITGCNAIEEIPTDNLKWTNNGSDSENLQLKVAIEGNIEIYDEYNLQAGTYNVKQTNINANDSEERIYNIYIVDNEDYTFDIVTMTTFPVATVGGVQSSNETEITLEEGQFMFISLVIGGKAGSIELQKQEWNRLNYKIR